MMKLKLFPLLLLVVLITFLGCSKNASNPVQPMDSQSDNPALSTQQESSRVLLGMYDLTFDPGSQNIDLVPVRTADMHINVTNYLFPPNCTDCVQYQVIHYFPNAKVANVDIKVKNPTTLIAYDVRGIVFSTNSNLFPLKQPDGYTQLYDIPGGNAYGINPFVAFGKETADRKLAGLTSQTAMFRFHFPGMWNVRLAFDASYPSHCEEPYFIGDFHLEAPLQSSENYESNARLYVKDWQNNISSIIIAIPEVTTDITGFYRVGELWRTDIMNELDADPGIYKGLVMATSGGQNLFQYVDVEVSRYGSIASILETCTMHESYDWGLILMDYAIADDESVYFVGDSNDWPIKASPIGRMDQDTCTMVESATYDLSFPPSAIMVDEDYIYGFGFEYCLYQKDYLGMIQKSTMSTNGCSDMVSEGDSVWVLHAIDSNQYGLAMYSIADPRNPVIIWSVPINERYAGDIEKKGKYLFVLTQDDPSSTQKSHVATYSSENGEMFDQFESDLEIQFTSIAVLGDFIYVGIRDKNTATTPNYSFKVLDASDIPWDIEFVGNFGSAFQYEESFSKLKIFNDVLYVRRENGLLSVYDLSEPWLPEVIGSVDIEDIYHLRDFVVHDNYLYAYFGDFSTTSNSTIDIVKYTMDWVE